MITVSKKVEYSMILLAYLAQKQGETISLSDAAKRLNLPYRFLGQISMALKANQILESKEGKKGGYSLNRGWEERSVYDLLEALGENKPMVECLGEGKCQREGACRFKRVFNKIEDKLMLELKNVKLKEI